tara:strand:- start:1104 stop:1514 length:411 start_codon:yes stop_codon:yes gene_type:complete
MLTAYVSGSGYPIVSFTGPGKKREYHNVHRLVLEAFVGPCPPTMECCHYDGNRTNNKLTNLRWDTRSNNALDANRHGTRNAAKGEDAHWAKLTEKNVKYIRANVDKLGQREMGRMFGVTHGTIGLVLKGQTWKHVK